MSEHHHAHVNEISNKKMLLAVLLTFLFCLGEALAGYFSNSLALMSDAGHNFADGLALALSAYALWVSQKPADHKKTFGYHRVGILAALVNAISLAVMAGIIFWEAFLRLYAPEPVQSGVMIWVALLAILLNSVIGWWLHAASKHDLNIRSVYLHMLGDAAASLGVVIAGIIIALTGAYIADPIVSIIFAGLVLWSSKSIFTESIHVLLEATPAGIELHEVETAIGKEAGVLSIHDLHVWSVSSGLVVATCHLQVAEQNVSDAQVIVDRVSHMLEHQFKIKHTTVQLEVTDCGGHEHGAHSDHHHHHH